MLTVIIRLHLLYFKKLHLSFRHRTSTYLTRDA